MTTQVTHYNALSIVSIDFDIWSGQTRLAAQDIKFGEGGEVPDARFAQLGTKRIIDPAGLKGFHRLKTESRRLLMAYGVPFMNGFAVPSSKIDSIIPRLDQISVEFTGMKNDFLLNYSSNLEEWIKENPENENAIREGALTLPEVEKRLSFEYQVFRIQPLDDEDNADRLNNKVASLGGDLIQEIVDTAEDFYIKRLARKTSLGINTRMTLANLRDKIDGLSFLNSSFEPLVRLLDDTIAGYSEHADGRVITAPFLYQVTAAVLILSDPKKIEDYANGSLAVDDVDVVRTSFGGTSTLVSAATAKNTAKPIPLSSAVIGESVEAEDVDRAIADDIDRFFSEQSETPAQSASNEAEQKQAEQVVVQGESVQVEQEIVTREQTKPEDKPVTAMTTQYEMPPVASLDSGSAFF